MRVDVFSCSADTYGAAIRRANFHYRGKGHEYVGPVVNGKLYPTHVTISTSDLSETQGVVGDTPTSGVYGLLVLEEGEKAPWKHEQT